MREGTCVRVPRWRKVWPWCLLWLVAVVGTVLQVCCLTGPDPRYLLIYDGMPSSQVDVLMGKPDYHDTWGPRDRPAYFYCYGSTEIIVEFDDEGRVCKKHFLW